MIQIEVIDHFEKFLSLEPIWNDLLSSSDLDIPFMTFEWFSCWWRSYGENKDLFIIVVRDGGEILGIAPLMKDEMNYRGSTIRVISFISNEHTNRIGFILIKRKQYIVDIILEYLITSSHKYEMLIFDFIEENSDTHRYLANALMGKKLKHRKIKSLYSPYIKISTDWDAFLKNRSKSLRKKIRRINNLINRTGETQVRKYSIDKLKTGIGEMLSVSKESWKHRSNTSIASNTKDTAFYSSLAEATSSKGWFNLWIVKMNNRPMAFEYKLIYKNISYSLKVGYAEEYGKLSPSLFLDCHSIKDSFLNGHKEYDLLGTNDDYKRGWTDLTRGHCSYWIFGNSVYAKIIGFLELNIISHIRKLEILRTLVRYLRKKKIFK